MSETTVGTLLVIAAYLSGSVPYGYVLTRWLAGVDVRQVGSGNIGATNAARAGGKALGVVVLALDVLKAVIPVLVARWLLAGSPRHDLWVTGVAVAAFAGHLFPVWLRFHGGKGVATGLGIFLVLSPWAALAGVVAYAALLAITRISSLGSLAGTAVCCLATFVWRGPGSPISWAGLVISLLVIWRHRENIRRLVRGQETRV
jgi:glycerol-3-phosphate acyltransferase PlsY